MMFDKYANLKYKSGNRYMGTEEYYICMINLNEILFRKIYTSERFTLRVTSIISAII